MSRTTNQDVKDQDERIIETFGFLRYSINGRYGYYAVDEHPKDRQSCCVSRNHITGVTKGDAYMYRNAIIIGACAVNDHDF